MIIELNGRKINMFGTKFHGKMADKFSRNLAGFQE